MKKLPWIVGGLMILTLGSLLLARQGTVVTRDGKRFVGDVTDTGTGYKVVQTDATGKHTFTIPKTEVTDVLWDTTPANPSKEMPTTKPVPETQPAAPTSRTSEAPKRQVTADEINRIKLLEWNQKDPINLRIDRDVIEKYLSNNPNMTRQDFAHLPKEQQAIDIMNERPDLEGGIHILADPRSVADFHTKIQRPLVTGCGAANCHGGPNAKAGNLYLYGGDNPTAYYTNFLTLQTFTSKVKDVPMPLIDRQNPENSLLLQYMLPPEVAVNPHPAAPPYKGAVKTSKDPRYQSVYSWISELSSLLPKYDIDLTTEAPKKDKDAGGARGAKG